MLTLNLNPSGICYMRERGVFVLCKINLHLHHLIRYRLQSTDCFTSLVQCVLLYNLAK